MTGSTGSRKASLGDENPARRLQLRPLERGRRRDAAGFRRSTPETVVLGDHPGAVCFAGASLALRSGCGSRPFQRPAKVAGVEPVSGTGQGPEGHRPADGFPIPGSSPESQRRPGRPPDEGTPDGSHRHRGIPPGGRFRRPAGPERRRIHDRCFPRPCGVFPGIAESVPAARSSHRDGRPGNRAAPRKSLLARARATLPRVGLLALREGRAALPLLDSLGVPRERIRVTGDDAIEPAFAARPDRLGTSLGVNVRVSTYSRVESGPFR